MRYKIILITIILMFFSFSCSVKNSGSGAGEPEGKNNTEETINEGDIHESDADLFKTDYREIYNDLSGKGEWIQINASELGLDVKKGSSGGEYEFQKFLAEITGVKNSYAEEADFGMIFVWKPSPELAISAGSDNMIQPVYQPYTNGQWVYTDNGWYFTAPTPEEEIVHHYGRWHYDPGMGWVWVPGRVWSPAWVDWKVSDNYIAWTPVPSGIYLRNDIIEVPIIPQERYVIVEKRYFVEPVIYQYRIPVVNTTTIYTDLRPVTGITVVNGAVVNRGPDVVTISTLVGTEIPKIKINKVKGIHEVKFSGNEIRTYYPEFRRGKNSNFVVQTKPNNFKKFNEVRVSAGTESKNNFKESEMKRNDNTDKVQNRGNEQKQNYNQGSNNSNNSGIQKSNQKSNKEMKNNNSGNDKSMKNNNGNNKGQNKQMNTKQDKDQSKQQSGDNHNNNGNKNKGNKKDKKQ